MKEQSFTPLFSPLENNWLLCWGDHWSLLPFYLWFEFEVVEIPHVSLEALPVSIRAKVPKNTSMFFFLVIHLECGLWLTLVIYGGNSWLLLDEFFSLCVCLFGTNIALCINSFYKICCWWWPKDTQKRRHSQLWGST